MYESDKQITHRAVGDSLFQSGHRTPKKVAEVVMRWLKTDFDEGFKNKGCTLEIGQQHDGSSCGVFVINAVAHHVLGAPLITQAEQRLERMRWFVNLTKTDVALDQVSIRLRYITP